ncbi:MAG: hypothetical protein OWQ59_00995 [Alicyclobacillaceae bacterium]|jgi:electron transfer flavoprotein alpha/beta subunit|uniref:electron transfer flavoprotein subunit beta/FixA family protein n=1 Tax=Alicyclobacillus sp. SP_1 TaxID=2942475 RepID=UPI0021575E88|nr:hypothetical protein [Alicyclobacillus sp. SP_1]MCY0887029.1 hypothetical protein [Alicyclobacillaceae bacterium]
MKVLVCVRSDLPAPMARVDNIQRLMEEWSAEWAGVLEPSCRSALQLAKDLSGPSGGFTALSYGRGECRAALEVARAYGAVDAVHLQSAEGSLRHDGNTIARALAAWVGERSFDVVVCGNSSGVGPVPALVAGHLGWPVVTRVDGFKKFLPQDDSFRAIELTQRLDAGWKRQVLARYPVVLSVQSGFIPPQYVSVRRRKEAVHGLASNVTECELPVWTDGHAPAVLQALTPPKPRTKRTAVPDAKSSAADRLKSLMGPAATKKVEKPKEDEGPRVVEGSAVELAEELLRFLRKKEFLSNS